MQNISMMCSFFRDKNVVKTENPSKSIKIAQESQVPTIDCFSQIELSKKIKLINISSSVTKYQPRDRHFYRFKVHWSNL